LVSTGKSNADKILIGKARIWQKLGEGNINLKKGTQKGGRIMELEVTAHLTVYDRVPKRNGREIGNMTRPAGKAKRRKARI